MALRAIFNPSLPFDLFLRKFELIAFDFRFGFRMLRRARVFAIRLPVVADLIANDFVNEFS